MKKIIFLALFFLYMVAKSQTISIATYVGQIPNGAYLKDIDNTLPLFSGKWISNFEGKQIVLNISDKVENYPFKSLNNNYYRDVLFMRYTITDSNGNQLANTMNNEMATVNIISTFTSSDKNRVAFDYRGEECGIGEGYIIFQKIDNSHARWEYHSTGGLIDPKQCANYSPNIKSYIPRTLDLTFTKQ
ncbi:DUF6705 family protein [Elizabethkingia anophelis]|uniref:DUF6705 family protein n=1 Tax=Elizabethkingia anophelis TaxID=1117645 RepID=UPI0021AB9A25|nr:hypothetical protein [Elizabethkingia anophelis]